MYKRLVSSNKIEIEIADKTTKKFCIANGVNKIKSFVLKLFLDKRFISI